MLSRMIGKRGMSPVHAGQQCPEGLRERRSAVQCLDKWLILRLTAMSGCAHEEKSPKPSAISRQPSEPRALMADG
jgi:hypothetical protein